MVKVFFILFKFIRTVKISIKVQHIKCIHTCISASKM